MGGDQRASCVALLYVMRCEYRGFEARRGHVRLATGRMLDMSACRTLSAWRWKIDITNAVGKCMIGGIEFGYEYICGYKYVSLKKRGYIELCLLDRLCDMICVH
jgi:hypothetical protein